MEPVSFEKGTLIFKAHDAADRVFGIESGSVAVSNGITDQDARPIPTSRGNIFGLIEVLAGSPHRVDLKAITPVSGWSLPGDRAIELLRNYPQLCLRVLTFIASKYNETIPFVK